MSGTATHPQPDRDAKVTTVPDTGCPDHLFASCVRCPLPRCRYDLNPLEFKLALHAARRRLAGEESR